MLNEEKINGLMDQIHISENDIGNLITNYAKLYTVYNSSLIYGTNQFDKSFFDTFENGMKLIREFEKSLQDNLSKLTSDANNSANSIIEIIPTAFK